MGATLHSSETTRTPRFLRLIGDSAIFSLGNLSGKVAALVLLPVVTSRLSPDSFGRLDVLSVATSAIGGTLVFGFDVASTRLYPTLRDEDRQRLFATWALLGVLASVGLGLVVALFAEPISRLLLDEPRFVNEVRLVVPIVVGALLLNVALGVQRNENQPWHYAACSGGAIVSSAILVVVLVLRSSSVQSVLLAQAIASVVFGVGSLLLVRRSIAARPSRVLWRQLGAIGLPLAPVSAVVAFGELANRSILLRLSDSGEVGLLSVAVRIGSVLLVLSLAIQTAWHPRAFSMRTQADAEERIGGDVVRLSSLAACASVALALATPATVDLVTGADYSGAVLPSGLMIVAGLGFFAAQLMSVGLLVDARTTRVALSVVLGVAISVSATLVLGGAFGAVGGTAALAIGQWVYAVSAWVFSRGGFAPAFKLSLVVVPNLLAVSFVLLRTSAGAPIIVEAAVLLAFAGALAQNGTLVDVKKVLTGVLLGGSNRSR